MNWCAFVILVGILICAARVVWLAGVVEGERRAADRARLTLPRKVNSAADLAAVHNVMMERWRHKVAACAREAGILGYTNHSPTRIHNPPRKDDEE